MSNRQMRRRILSCLLAVCMVLTIIPAGVITAFGDYVDDLQNINYTITYDVCAHGDGTGPSRATINYFGSLRDLLPELHENNYIFDGWYYDTAYTRPASESDFGFRSDFTLYAKWSPDTTEWYYYELYEGVVVITGYALSMNRIILPQSLTGRNTPDIYIVSNGAFLSSSIYYDGTKEQRDAAVTASADFLLQHSSDMNTLSCSPLPDNLYYRGAAVFDEGGYIEPLQPIYGFVGDSFTMPTPYYPNQPMDFANTNLTEFNATLNFEGWLKGLDHYSEDDGIIPDGTVYYTALWTPNRLIMQDGTNVYNSEAWDVVLTRAGVYVRHYNGFDENLAIPAAVHTWKGDYPITSLGVPRELYETYFDPIDEFTNPYGFHSLDYYEVYNTLLTGWGKVFNVGARCLVLPSSVTDTKYCNSEVSLLFDCPASEVAVKTYFDFKPQYKTSDDWTFTTDTNGTRITGCSYTDYEVYIPVILGGKPVVSLGNGSSPVFSTVNETIHVPDTIETLYYRALYNVTDIYYDGTRDDWQAITGYGNWDTANSVIHYLQKVTFDYNGISNNENYTQIVEENSHISRPADPQADGYRFLGWFNERLHETAFDFSAPITNDTVIYAGWALVYTVTLPQDPVGCTVTTQDDTTVIINHDFTFTVTPEAGYTIQDLVVRSNGNELTGTALGDGSYQYTITALRTDQTVTVFGAQSIWEYSSDGSGITVSKYNGQENHVIVPDEFDSLPVTAIGNGAFAGKTGIETVNLPSTVTSIGNEAFSGCSFLESIDIPDGITSIGASAFSGCIINSLNIPNGVSYLGQNSLLGVFRVVYDGSNAQWNSLTGTKTVIGTGAEMIFLRLTVSYDMGGIGTAPASYDIVKGQTAAEPDDPEAEGYRFGGWYTDGTFATEFDFTSALNDDTVICAKWIEQTVYLDENGASQIHEDCIDMQSALNASETITSGWYVVKGYVRDNNYLTIDGDVKIILADGAELSVVKGIIVNAGNSVTFYAQSAGNYAGKVYVSVSPDYTACIGSEKNKDAGSITINGGRFDLNSQFYAACIGGGQGGSSSNITVNGGIINATALNDAACIGAGQGGDAGTININGGTLNLNASGFSSIGIGSSSGNGGSIAINGGNVSVTVNTDRAAYGIGSRSGDKGSIILGYTNSTDSIYSPSYRGNISFADGKQFICADMQPPVIATTATVANHFLTPLTGSTVTVTFVDHGNVVNTYTFPEGIAIPRPEDPAGEYEFLGWYAQGASAPYDFETIVHSDLELVAKWVEPYTEYTALSGTEGANSSENYDSFVDNHSETKWCVTGYHTGTIETVFASDDIIVPVGYQLTTGNDTDTNPGRNPVAWTLEAKKNYADEWTVLAQVTADDPAVLEAASTKTYNFPLNNPDENEYRFFRFAVTAIKEYDVFQLAEISLISKSESVPPKYTVSFDGNGGSDTMDSVETSDGYVLPDSGFTAPADKYFKGWLVNNKLYDSKEVIPVTSDLTVYAQWGDYCTVSYEPNGGTWGNYYDDEVKVAEGQTIKLPGSYAADPPEGLTFSCWTDGTDEYEEYAEYTVTGNVTIYPLWREPGPWEILADQLKDINGPAEITLTQDVIAAPNSTSLIVPEYRTVTIDLNGYTIDRALTEETSSGRVFCVLGNLTVKDSSEAGTGRITGGFNSGDGGGVYVDEDACFTLEGGTISGNKAQYGGGVEITGGTFTMTGGVITGNRAEEYGGGIEYYNNATVIFSGSPRVTGNCNRLDYDSGSSDNVYVYSNAVIEIQGQLTPVASIGISTGGYQQLTSGLGNNSVSAFFADNTACGIVLNDETGEAEIVNNDEPEYPDPVIIGGHSLCPDGNVGVNFYVNMFNIGEDSYAVFKFDDQTVEVPVDFNKYAIINGSLYYKFSCSVNSVQTDTPITAEFFGIGFSSGRFTYSVSEYLTEVKQHMGDDAELMALASAMATYGYYANELFDYNPDFNRHELFDDSGFDTVTTQSLEDYEAQATNLDGGVNYYGSSLVLRSATSIRHYFTLPEGKTIDDYTFTLGSGDSAPELKPVTNDGTYYYVEISNIAAPLLGNAYTVNVADSTGETVNTWVYSALSYVYAALEKADANNPKVTDELVNAVKALVYYYTSAAAYFDD